MPDKERLAILSPRCVPDVPQVCPTPKCAPGVSQMCHKCVPDVPKVCFLLEICPRCATGVHRRITELTATTLFHIITHAHFTAKSREIAYETHPSVAKPTIGNNGKLIKFGISPLDLTCISTSDENAQVVYKWRRNNIIV